MRGCLPWGAMGPEWRWYGAAGRGSSLLEMVWVRQGMIGRMLGALCLVGVASPALAHPHVFVDTGLEVIFDDQARATGVRITWNYDEYFSLVVAEDHKIDQDYDGNATPDEEKILSGFDMAWDEGYPGDTYAIMGDTDLPLSPPKDWTASYKDGKITTSHLRTFGAPVAVGKMPLQVQVYDTTLYTGYFIVGTPRLTGAPDICKINVVLPDRVAADKILQAAIDKLSTSMDVENEFPPLGKYYAEEVRVICDAAS